MSKKRVSDLAKDYGMKGPELVELLKRAGFDRVKNHMTQLDDAELMLATAVIETQRPKTATATASDGGAEAERGEGGRGIPKKKSLPPPVAGTTAKEPTKELPRKKLTDKVNEKAADKLTERGSDHPADKLVERVSEGTTPVSELEGGAALELEPKIVKPVKKSLPTIDAGTETAHSRTASPKPLQRAPHPVEPEAETKPKVLPKAKPIVHEPAAEAKPPQVEASRPSVEPAVREPETRPAAHGEAAALQQPVTGGANKPTPPAIGETRTGASETTPPAGTEVPRTVKAPAAESTTTPPQVAPAAAVRPHDPSVKRLLVPQARAQVVGRIELPQETIRDARSRSAPATGRDTSADRNLRRQALLNTQSRTAARPNTGPAARRGTSGGTMGSRSTGSGGRSGMRRGRGPAIAANVDPNKIVEIEPPISIKGLSEALGIKVNDLIATLTFKLNVKGKTINSFLTPEEVELVGLACERNIKIVERREAETELIQGLLEDAQDEESVARAPVVTFMGHVDHGKTSLLDALRKSDVAQGEAGGITQHVGAYRITTADDRSFVVLDTPGHAAFTSMRARGANVTDIIVLVVAADDGVMPQTEEAINHARAAKDARGHDVPIIVAINKVDKPQANPMQVRQQLSLKGLQPEEWGGTTQMVNVSATTGKGLDELVNAIMLVAEAEIDLKCRPSASGQGTVIEVKQTPEQGVLVNVLVTDGTLRVKDKIICGNSFARVRALLDDHGHQIDEAGPSTPVQVFGLSELPQPGDKLFVVSAENQEKAKEVIEDRQRRARDMSLAERSTVTLETLNAALAARKVQEIKLILKADVMGSLEPIKKILGDLATEEVRINIIHSGLGGISETDVELAAASKAIIIGFNSVADSAARQSAERQGVEIRYYDVIYSVVDEMRLAMEGLLAPERLEKVTGHADIRAVFKSSKFGNIAGCYVTDGIVTRNSKARLIRDGKVVFTGDLGSLKRVKDDVREVKANFECGLTLANYNDIREGDKLEFYSIEMIKRTLE